METDKEFIINFEKEAGDGIPKDDLENAFRYKNFQNIFLFKGFIPDVFTTFFENKPETQIALLHIDVDVKEKVWR